MSELLIIQYYDESSIRRKRRRDLLEKVVSFFNTQGYENITMAELAERLSLNRRTLYSYYNNKSELVIDSYLFAVEILAQEHARRWRELSASIAGLSAREKFRRFLEHYGQILLESYQSGQFDLNYDAFIGPMDKGDPAYIRFFSVREQFSAKEPFLREIISDGIDSGELTPPEVSLDDYVMIIEQAFRSYMLRISKRKNYTRHYQSKNAGVFIDIMIDGMVLSHRK